MIYDAVNAIERTHVNYYVDAVAPEARREAATAAASHRILVNLYPTQRLHLTRNWHCHWQRLLTVSPKTMALT